MWTLTSRGQTVDVGQQLGLGHSRVAHQADVDVALWREDQEVRQLTGDKRFYRVFQRTGSVTIRFYHIQFKISSSSVRAF